MSKPVDTWRLLVEWRRLLPEQTVFAGRTAAWLHGLPLKATDPVDIIVPPRILIRRAGVFARRCVLPLEEVTKGKGLPATTIHRALADICVREQPIEALIAIDMAYKRRLTDCTALSAYAEAAVGRRHVRRLRMLAALGAPAESPMETRLRWILHQAGLPLPEVQVELRNEFGDLLGRADMYYPKARLVIEFDGGYHRDALVSDDRRQNLLMSAGYRVLRFTSPDVYERSPFVANQVRGNLAAT